MADDKGYTLGYVLQLTKELERDLMEMESNLDPLLTSLEMGDDPHQEFGSGATQRIRDACDCKDRAWAKFKDLVAKLAVLRAQSGGVDLARADSSRTGAKAGKPVKLMLTGMLVED